MIFFFFFKLKLVVVLVTQSCLTLCNPMDCSLPDSSVHGNLQARILERIAVPFSRGSSWLRGWTWFSCIAGRFFTIWATRKTLNSSYPGTINICVIPALLYSSPFYKYVNTWNSNAQILLMFWPGVFSFGDKRCVTTLFSFPQYRYH